MIGAPDGLSPAPRGSFRATAAIVVAYAIAMAYVESAVVVYLDHALAIGDIFPLRPADALGNLAAIEVGREAATLVMLGTVGWLTGRTLVERLAWCAVAFGVWDVGYYAWLWVFSGWPTSPASWDLLFLIPVPWTGPVWAPSAVSAALVGFGLAAARRLRTGRAVRVGPGRAVLAAAGGLIVVLSFTLDAPWIMAGGMPRSFPWPVFVAGMAIAAAAAASALGAFGRPAPGGEARQGARG